MQVFCTLGVFKNLVKVGFLLLSERGSATKYLVCVHQKHSCFDG